MGEKVIFGHFGVFLALKKPLGHTQELSRSTNEQKYVASIYQQLYSKFRQNPRHQFFTIILKVSIIAILGRFQPPGGVTTRPKRKNDEVSSTGTCKFEFSAIKNHYKDIREDILDKYQKSPQKGAFSALKAPGARNAELWQGPNY